MFNYCCCVTKLHISFVCAQAANNNKSQISAAQSSPVSLAPDVQAHSASPMAIDTGIDSISPMHLVSPTKADNHSKCHSAEDADALEGVLQLSEIVKVQPHLHNRSLPSCLFSSLNYIATHRFNFCNTIVRFGSEVQSCSSSNSNHWFLQLACQIMIGWRSSCCLGSYQVQVSKDASRTHDGQLCKRTCLL